MPSHGSSGPPAKPPGLESTLYRLTRAEDPAAFASEHGLRVSEGRVLVVVELRDGGTIPGEYEVAVTSSYGTQVQAYVAFEDLVGVANAADVRFVRRPLESEDHGPTDTRQ